MRRVGEELDIVGNACHEEQEELVEVEEVEKAQGISRLCMQSCPRGGSIADA